MTIRRIRGLWKSLGYNKFKSSNPNVIAHENLLVTRQKTDTQVTITSWSRSERYGRFAEKYPENEKLQKLYHQEISVTVTVLGTQVPQEALQEVTDEAQKLADGMTEGSAPGAYPEGTRAALQEAITKAQDVLKNPDATEQEVRTAIRELKDALEHAKAAQNAKTANVTVRMNEENGTPSAAYRITVKADDATAYGYKKPEALKNEVTAADALYAAHAKRYGDAFAKDPSHYLVINSKGMISTLYGRRPRISDMRSIISGWQPGQMRPCLQMAIPSVSSFTMIHPTQTVISIFPSFRPKHSPVLISQ